MKEIGKQINNKGKVNLLVQTKEYTLVDGEIISYMVMVNSLGLTVKSLQENTNSIWNKEKEDFNGLMVRYMMECGLKVNSMEKEFI